MSTTDSNNISVLCAISRFPEMYLMPAASFPFELDGQYCASIGSFMYSLLFGVPEERRNVASLCPACAEMQAHTAMRYWRVNPHPLYWNGQQYVRDSREYQYLILRAHEARARQNMQVAQSMFLTRNSTYQCTMYGEDKKATLVTDSELIETLYYLRQLMEQDSALQWWRWKED